MNLFDVSHISEDHLTNYLKRLDLARQAPALSYLNQLIERQQSRIPFENLTRICDYHELPEKFVSLEKYLDRIPSGTGGVCWSLARSFHWLLKSLGFNVQYLYMDSGHVCLKVTLENEYYVDVGYGAPFFEAKLLNESFVVQSNAERFEYKKEADHVLVTRQPGPVKTLNLSPVSSEFISLVFEQGNVWKTNKFLSLTVMQKFADHKLIKLKNGMFMDYRDTDPKERLLTNQELERILIDQFQLDPKIYAKALNYLKSP